MSFFHPKFRSSYRRHVVTVLHVRKLALFDCRHTSLLLRLMFCLFQLNSAQPTPVCTGVLSLVCTVQPSISLRRTVSSNEGNRCPPLPTNSLTNIKLRFTCIPKLQDRPGGPLTENTTPCFHCGAYCTVWPSHYSQLSKGSSASLSLSLMCEDLLHIVRCPANSSSRRVSHCRANSSSCSSRLSRLAALPLTPRSSSSLSDPSPSARPSASSCLRFAVAISAACFFRHLVRRFWNHT